MQLAFFFDQSRCSGCLTCVVACRQWHSVDHDAVTWRRVETIEGGSFPDLRVSFLSLSCLHCQSCPCIPSCPSSAMMKREQDGIVLVSPDLCLGEQTCGRCKDACPYHVPAYNPETGLKMEKCDLCSGRRVDGKRPICVEACPMRALDAGDLEEMRRKHGTGTEAEGFHYSLETRPSIILKRK